MNSQRPLALTLIAVVAGAFALLPLIRELYFAYQFVGTTIPFGTFFKLNLGDIISMLLWTGLLITVYRQSRWAVVFSFALAIFELALLLLARIVFGGIIGPDGFTVFTLMAIITFAVPLFVLEATFKLWRRGQLR